MNELSAPYSSGMALQPNQAALNLSTELTFSPLLIGDGIATGGRLDLLSHPTNFQPPTHRGWHCNRAHARLTRKRMGLSAPYSSGMALQRLDLPSRDRGE